MKWIPLTSQQQLPELVQKSQTTPQIIYKHSTRCGTSHMVLDRLERTTNPPPVDFYFLDLIKYRDISAKVAEDFQVHHESPQVLLISKGKCLYDESHYGITMDEIAEQLASVS